MRDPRDRMTAELPGVPELPPPPVARPTQGERREACGYMGPRSTPSCRHCAHSAEHVTRPDSFAQAVHYRCGLHDFPVELGALCNDFQAAGPRSGAPS